MLTKRLSKPLIVGAAAVLTAAGMGMYVWKEDHRPPILEIYIFALKTGRSVFIRTPDDKRILIDGGGTSDIVSELTKILPFYSRRIDTVIATNDDGKNVSGLIDVVSRYAVDRAYIPAITTASLGLASSTDQIYPTLIETLNQKKIPVYEAKAGDTISFGQNISASILFPTSTDSFAYSKTSAPELLMQISYDSTIITLLGDAAKKIQKSIASQGVASSSVVYVSQDATSDTLFSELFQALNPEYLIYSKAISKTTAKPVRSDASKAAASSKKKEVVDPLAGILEDNRFNLKEYGSVLITVNGGSITIKKAP